MPADTATGTGVPQASATPAVSAASANPVKSVVAANSQLEKQVSELAASYDKVHAPCLLLCFLVFFPSGRCVPVPLPPSLFISIPAQANAPPQTPCLYGFAGGLRRFLPFPPPLFLVLRLQTPAILCHPPSWRRASRKRPEVLPQHGRLLTRKCLPPPHPFLPPCFSPLVFHHSWRNLLASRASHLDQHLWTRHLEDFPK